MHDDTEKITIRLPKETLRRIDYLVSIGDFPSRSEAIRTAVRDLIYQRADVVIDKASKLREMDLKMAEYEAIRRLLGR